jgi:CheY-like chemotaxis protein
MDEGDYVILTVTDTGTGMPPAVVQRAIEPFFTTKPPAAGSGLGLSMAYGFAKQSGGHLDIESSVGLGTRVSLYLPRAQQAGEPPVDVTTASQVEFLDASGTETILLVDDNQSLMLVTQCHLAGLGYRVIPATNAQSALAILASRETIHLLFTDVVMPGDMSGPDLAEAAQQLRPGLRVLFTTGYADKCSEAPERHVLRKPYDRRGMASAVRAALDAFAPSA